jgi:hypothetical protein
MTIRTVGDLKRRLEDYDENQPLRVARREMHPIASTLKGLTSTSEAGGEEQDEMPGEDTVWLVLTALENYDAYQALWDAAY